jgi:hypothetical protein
LLDEAEVLVVQQPSAMRSNRGREMNWISLALEFKV